MKFSIVLFIVANVYLAAWFVHRSDGLWIVLMGAAYLVLMTVCDRYEKRIEREQP